MFRQNRFRFNFRLISTFRLLDIVYEWTMLGRTWLLWSVLSSMSSNRFRPNAPRRQSVWWNAASQYRRELNQSHRRTQCKHPFHGPNHGIQAPCVPCKLAHRLHRHDEYRHWCYIQNSAIHKLNMHKVSLQSSAGGSYLWKYMNFNKPCFDYCFAIKTVWAATVHDNLRDQTMIWQWKKQTLIVTKIKQKIYIK